MKTLKDAAKDMLLAGLGNIDEQNDEIKDLLRRGKRKGIIPTVSGTEEALRWIP